MKGMVKTRLSVWLMITLVMLALLTVPLLAKEYWGLEVEPSTLNEEQSAARNGERILEFAGRK